MLTKLEDKPGVSIMADLCFKIDLNVSLFLEGRKQLPAAEVE